MAYLLDRRMVRLILCNPLGQSVPVVGVAIFSKPGGTGLASMAVLPVDVSLPA